MGRPIIKFSKRYGKVLGSINPDNHYPLYMFMYIIIMYALENNSAFNALSKHKLSAIHFIRMQEIAVWKFMLVSYIEIKNVSLNISWTANLLINFV